MADDEMLWQQVFGPEVGPERLLDGKYRLERIVGHGAMAVVVEATHEVLRDRVAIKVLQPSYAGNEEAVARFEQEARAAFAIKGPHVVHVLDVNRLPNGPPYIVMELLDGSDLGARLRDGPLPIAEAVDLLLQACEAVAEAHRNGIVHRDLKPENLFVTRMPDGSPCVKVLDFGISKVSSSSALRSRALTGEEVSMGTPLYMSPEQWLSTRDVGPATDIWSIGVILFELIAGEPPFSDPQLAQLCSKILKGEPPTLRSLRADVPGALSAAVARCLARQPGDRFASVAELALALEPFASSLGRTSVARVVGILGAAEPEAPPEPARKRRSLAPWAIAAAVLAGGVLAWRVALDGALPAEAAPRPRASTDATAEAAPTAVVANDPAPIDTAPSHAIPAGAQLGDAAASASARPAPAPETTLPAPAPRPAPRPRPKKSTNPWEWGG